MSERIDVHADAIYTLPGGQKVKFVEDGKSNCDQCCFPLHSANCLKLQCGGRHRADHTSGHYVVVEPAKKEGLIDVAVDEMYTLPSGMVVEFVRDGTCKQCCVLPHGTGCSLLACRHYNRADRKGGHYAVVELVPVVPDRIEYREVGDVLDIPGSGRVKVVIDNGMAASGRECGECVLSPGNPDRCIIRRPISHKTLGEQANATRCSPKGRPDGNNIIYRRVPAPSAVERIRARVERLRDRYPQSHDCYGAYSVVLDFIGILPREPVKPVDADKAALEKQLADAKAEAERSQGVANVLAEKLAEAQCDYFLDKLEPEAGDKCEQCGGAMLFSCRQVGDGLCHYCGHKYAVELKSERNHLHTKLGAAQTNVVNLRAANERLVATSKNYSDKQQADLDICNATVRSLREEVAGLELDDRAKAIKIRDLQTQLAAAEAETAELHVELDASFARHKETKQQLADAEFVGSLTIVKLQKQLADAKRRYSECTEAHTRSLKIAKADVRDEYKAELSDASDEITGLQNEIALMERERKEMRETLAAVKEATSQAGPALRKAVAESDEKVRAEFAAMVREEQPEKLPSEFGPRRDRCLARRKLCDKLLAKLGPSDEPSEPDQSSYCNDRMMSELDKILLQLKPEAKPTRSHFLDRTTVIGALIRKLRTDNERLREELEEVVNEVVQDGGITTSTPNAVGQPVPLEPTPHEMVAEQSGNLRRLRGQLTNATGHNRELEALRDRQLEIITDLRKQLAEARAENERVRKLHKNRGARVEELVQLCETAEARVKAEFASMVREIQSRGHNGTQVREACAELLAKLELEPKPMTGREASEKVADGQKARRRGNHSACMYELSGGGVAANLPCAADWDATDWEVRREC